LVKAPTQELTVGVEHGGLAELPEGGRVLVDLAEQERFSAAEGHHARGGSRERLEDLGPTLDRILTRYGSVAKIT
jgi:hypothetical protein